MPLNSVNIIQGQISQNLRDLSVLHGGSVVKGRVLAKNADGSFTISVAGQKLSVRSESELEQGAVFSAKVSVCGSSVRLVLLKEGAVSDGLVQKFYGSESSLPRQISEFLVSLGFEPNLENLRILQFMQQIGMKINVHDARKALQDSKKDGPENQEKAQISLLFEEKGMRAGDERVAEILGRERDGSKDSGGRRENQEEREPEGEKKLLSEKLTSLDIKKYFDSVDEASRARKDGILTAFNTVLSSGAKNPPLRHWLVLPFEWDFKNSFGTIRLLLDSERKNLEKVIVDLRNSERNAVFVLSYAGKQASSLKFSFRPDFGKAMRARLRATLSSMFGSKIDAEYCDFSHLQGFCPSDEVFSFVRGEL